MVPVLVVPRVFFFLCFLCFTTRGLGFLVRLHVVLVRGVQSATSGSNSGSYGITRGMRNRNGTLQNIYMYSSPLIHGSFRSGMLGSPSSKIRMGGTGSGGEVAVV